MVKRERRLLEEERGSIEKQREYCKIEGRKEGRKEGERWIVKRDRVRVERSGGKAC